MGFSISKSVISCWDVTINTFADLRSLWGAIIVCRDFIAMETPPPIPVNATRELCSGASVLVKHKRL